MTRGKESACNAGDPGLITGSGISPGGGNGNPLQYSCLENPMDCIIYGVAESDMTKHFSLIDFGHLIQRTDSLEKTLMLGQTEGRRRRDDRG